MHGSFKYLYLTVSESPVYTFAILSGYLAVPMKVVNLPSFTIQPMTMLQQKVTLPYGHISFSRLERDEEEEEENHTYEPIPCDQHGH